MLSYKVTHYLSYNNIIQLERIPGTITRDKMYIHNYIEDLLDR